MKKSSIIIYTVLLIFWFYFSGSAQDISLSAGIDRTEMLFEETVTMTVEVKWPGDITQFRFEILPLPGTENLKVLGTTSTISSIEENNQEYTVRTFKYTFKPTKGGIGAIMPIILSYITMPDSLPGDLATQEFHVSIAQPVPPPEEGGLGLVYVLIIISVVIVVIILIVYLVRKRKGDDTPVLTPEQKLLEELKTIRDESSVDRKLFYTRLYKLLTDYLTAKYDIDTVRKSPQEICDKLGSLKLSAGFKEKYSGWLIQADKEKFAPGSGSPGDTIRLITEIGNHFQSIDTDTKSEAK